MAWLRGASLAARPPWSLALRAARPRALAILPQPPAFSPADKRRELRLRKHAESTAQHMRSQVWLAKEKPKQFRDFPTVRAVLRYYTQHRPWLTPRDAAAAFLAAGKLLRGLAYCETPPRDGPRLKLLREDLAACAVHLHARDLTNVLLAAHYVRVKDEELEGAVCGQAVGKASQLSTRDVATMVYALGKLGRKEERLLRVLLARVQEDVDEMHAIELMYVASGLHDLSVAPMPVLAALSEAAQEKIEQFGPRELAPFIASLGALGWHDRPLLEMVQQRMPLLLIDMSPTSVVGVTTAIAAADAWLPTALDQLCDHAAATAHLFEGEQAAAMLGALGRLRWDHTAACAALSAAAAAAAPRLSLTHLGLALRAASRLPSAASPDALRALRDGVALRLEAAPPSRAMLPSVALVCSALLQLRLPPPARLLAVAAQLEAEVGGAPHGDEERRALRRVSSARSAWEAAPAGGEADAIAPPPLAGALPAAVISPEIEEALP
ncbi:hypothetical protein AB1Y20_007967 [Prymnesium parvum]|uniref:RNA-editing substrate-binding complex 6 protein domain-containing protein n=1 Tax=Prymnesium parvum TaxID=97485 RepID=A0AB34IV93_PRYPA